MTLTYATDIVTFYQPQFWGVETSEDLTKWVSANPEKFWETIMQVLEKTGVKGIELTFAPGNIENVLKTFGSGKAFKREMDSRGLSIVSSFVADGPNWNATSDIEAIVADAERRASFLVEVGADILVGGLPMRRTLGQRPPFFIDASYMGRMADIAHRVGEAVSQMGVKLAVHTESNSSLWLERDIDLFMSVTDPRYVWLCPDSCHIALGGGDPVRVAQRYNQRIILAHWKDAVGPMDTDLVIDETIYAQQQRFMAEMGEGVIDWKGWSEAMLRTPGKDIVLIELDAAVDPAHALEAGKAVVQKAYS